MITRNWIKWPTGEQLPGFFYGGVNRPTWLARNMSAWAHLRSAPTVHPVGLQQAHVEKKLAQYHGVG